MQLTITFDTRDITLPLHYRPLIHGMVYHMMQPLPESNLLHQKQGFKGFTFGPLQGGYTIEKDQICFLTGAQLQIRSVDEQLIRTIASAMIAEEKVRLGNQILVAGSISISKHHISQNRIKIAMLAPAVAYTTDQNRHTRFYSPEEPEFYTLLVNNARKKWEQFGNGTLFNFSICLATGNQPKKVFDIFRKTYITGYMGVFELSGSPAVLDMLYQIGLGMKNSEGFGMFQVIG